MPIHDDDPTQWFGFLELLRALAERDHVASPKNEVGVGSGLNGYRLGAYARQHELHVNLP
jgi:hypothetical protein